VKKESGAFRFLCEKFFMKPFIRSLILLAAVFPFLFIQSSSLARNSKVNVGQIYGKIQLVQSFPDYKVKVVDSFPDLKVQLVNSFPDKPGKWQIVNSFPDYKIQLVDSFPDFTIKYVNSFPGPE